MSDILPRGLMAAEFYAAAYDALTTYGDRHASIVWNAAGLMACPVAHRGADRTICYVVCRERFDGLEPIASYTDRQAFARDALTTLGIPAEVMKLQEEYAGQPSNCPRCGRDAIVRAVSVGHALADGQLGACPLVQLHCVCSSKECNLRWAAPLSVCGFVLEE